MMGPLFSATCAPEESTVIVTSTSLPKNCFVLYLSIMSSAASHFVAAYWRRANAPWLDSGTVPSERVFIVSDCSKVSCLIDPP